MEQPKQKRPVYAVVKPVGNVNEDGTQPVILLEIKTTRAGADAVSDKTPGSVVEKRMLVSE